MDIQDLMKAESDRVAVAFICWLKDKKLVDPNCRKYSLHLTEARTCRLHTAQYDGPYNLFSVKGFASVDKALKALEATEAYRATQKANGGNGVFQAVFGKFREFWEFVEGGGENPTKEIDSATKLWATVCQTIKRENAK